MSRFNLFSLYRDVEQYMTRVDTGDANILLDLQVRVESQRRFKLRILVHSIALDRLRTSYQHDEYRVKRYHTACLLTFRNVYREQREAGYVA